MIRIKEPFLLAFFLLHNILHWQGLDAFLKHSVVEPQMPDGLVNLTYGILADLEYVTLAGWDGLGTASTSSLNKRLEWWGHDSMIP